MSSEKRKKFHSNWKLGFAVLGECVSYIFDNGKKRIEVQFSKEKRDGERVWVYRRFAL